MHRRVLVDGAQHAALSYWQGISRCIPSLSTEHHPALQFSARGRSQVPVPPSASQRTMQMFSHSLACVQAWPLSAGSVVVVVDGHPAASNINGIKRATFIVPP